MFTHDPYMVRGVEYLTCLGFLVVFSLFWRFVNTEPAALSRARVWAGQFADWFKMPERVYFHPGHAWARLESPGVMAIGIDDFAQHLVGRIGRIVLPTRGQTLIAGQRALAVRVDGKAIDMVAPVTGTVLAINQSAVDHPEVINDDPYGRGWLMKVQVPRTASAIKTLLTGRAAREWIDSVSQQLMQTMSPELGQLCQDGGLPVHGLARAIDEEHWEAIARRFLDPRPEAVDAAPTRSSHESVRAEA
jgi:glycine cleavage system H protein